jgi:hypothetical protein
MLKLDFSFDTKYGVFRDALYLLESHGYTQDQIDAMQADRLSNWLSMVENPPANDPGASEPEGV